MQDEKPTTIYALVDCRDDLPHYIGKTVQDPPENRLRQHIQNPGTAELAAWLDDLAEADKTPQMQVLETVPPGADWRAAEIDWIRRGLHQGWPLVNTTSGGDNYALALRNASAETLVPRTIYGDEALFRLLVQVNAYVMRGKRREDESFRELLHAALDVVAAPDAASLHTRKQALQQRILSHGIVQMGRGWRVPVKVKKNLVGGVFLGVGKPFALNGIGFPGDWDGAGWRVQIKLRLETSNLLDQLATVADAQGQRRGFAALLRAALEHIAAACDAVKAM